MFNIIGTIIFGAVIGFLAKFIRQDAGSVSAPATVGLGVAGVVVGNLILSLFGYPADTRGIDWIRWIVVTIVAIIFIGIYVGSSGRKR
ncbi:putative membrane protein YeaQ/YmgE (transglycosylase-associated protein family) [Trueperella bonasi]|uniref:Membrane protein YeaQ/YmgE (Transglycosylase-associated protein family) n=1 Tax=Trueperella bonasi TaxID=312286 RepID=A0ABT9NGE4_9ACTO|nr:GlsB/YeaQ/YmgE family stress response membrane protein [Trueperella bonasi]MDP9806250.1 putative membrane protein YeaQ/YmgE (transglycosylase-associated protein family) [Trueperella bonasi]